MGRMYNMVIGGGGGIRLQSIAITTPPAKTAYKSGERFDPTGMVVTAAYSNGAALTATGYAVEPDGALTDGLEAVTVRYTEGGVSAEAVQPITVEPVLAALRIDTPPAKTEYRYGESFDPAGMVVTAVYSDGSTRPVSGYTVHPESFQALGRQKVSLSYFDGDWGVVIEFHVTVGRAVIAAVPSQKGTPAYTGEVQAPEWVDYDPGQLTISGVQTATGAGTYEAAFTPTPFYEWEDGGTGSRLIPWTIAKAAGSITVSPEEVTLDASWPLRPLQVDWAGDGAISATSSDESVIVVDTTGGVVQVYAVDGASGSAIVTVRVGEGSNHLAAEASVKVTASFVQIYGAEWDGSASTKLSRTDAAALFTDPVPAVGNGAGSSPFDDIMPWAGMTRVTQDGNELVAIPKYWVKVSHVPFKVQISRQPVAGFQVSPAHRDREDGQGERDVVYIGRYECDNSYKSRTGQVPIGSNNSSEFRSGIAALGVEYWQADIALQLTWWFLYIVEFSDWDGQTTIGLGNVNNSEKINTGGTDSMTYHTGRAAGTDGMTAVQYRHIENLWGNAREIRDGIVYYGSNLYTYNTPADYCDTHSGTNAVMRSLGISNKSGWINEWGYETNDPSFILPSKADGENASFVADYFERKQGGWSRIEVGGCYVDGTKAGPFWISFGQQSGEKNTRCGSRIQKLPNAT